MVNIRSHVPVLLNLNESNYGQWRTFFGSVLGKFGLTHHVVYPLPPLAYRTPEWSMNDHYIVNWLHTTCTKSVFDIVYRTDSFTYTFWGDLENLFRDNQLSRAVHYEAEFCSIC